jgi:AAA domain
MHTAGSIVTLEEEADRQLLAGLRTGDWLDCQTFPPITWTVPGLVPQGITLLVGPPKAGKSWLSLNIALAAAAGGRALGALPVDEPQLVVHTGKDLAKVAALRERMRWESSTSRRLRASGNSPRWTSRLCWAWRTPVKPGSPGPTTSVRRGSQPRRLIV